MNHPTETRLRIFATALALSLTLLAGCATIEPAVQAAAGPEPGMAYVAGQFTRSNSGGFAFVIKDVDLGKEYAMSLGEDSTWPSDVNEQVIAIKLPPGRYALTQWFTYATLTKERSRSHPITNPELSKSFRLNSGSVMFLGGFKVDTAVQGGQIYWSIKPRVLREERAQQAFDATYPGLGKLAFECRLCISPLTPPWMIPEER